MSEQINCHGDVSQGGIFRFEQPTWKKREGEPYVGDFRSCSHCGSIHPEDLARLLEAGATMHGADWKYGWPHKFYVENIPNLIGGKVVEMGGSSAEADTPGAVWKSTCVHADCAERTRGHGYWVVPHMQPAPSTMTAKFYNEHLKDASDELLAKLVPLVLKHTGIEFHRDPEKGLGYRAPSPGYQR